MRLLDRGTRTFEMEVLCDVRGEVLDITEAIELAVQSSGLEGGLVSVFCRHTTCGIFINENEEGLIEDLNRHLARLVPEGYFAHDDLARRTQNLQSPGEAPNGTAHIRQLLLGATSQTIPIFEGRLGLGRWQRILFVELDEPRLRSIWVTVIGPKG